MGLATSFAGNTGFGNSAREPERNCRQRAECASDQQRRAGRGFEQCRQPQHAGLCPPGGERADPGGQRPAGRASISAASSGWSIQFLQQENLAASGSASQYDTMAGLFTQLNGLLGGPGDNQSLATGLTSLASAFGHGLAGAHLVGQLYRRAECPRQCGVADQQCLQHHFLAAVPGRPAGRPAPSHRPTP